MSLAASAREFARPLWRGLFAAAGAGLLGIALMGTGSADLPSLCGGSWLPLVAAVGPVEALWYIFATASLPGQEAEWAVMLVAMMPPLLAQPIDHVLRSSRPSGRARAVAGFTLGYGAIWMLAGVPLVLLALLLVAALGDVAPVAALVLALTWSASPWQRRAQNRGHRVRRLSVLGWRADRDAIAYGVVHGGWCVSTCWAWMLVPLTLANHHLPAMMAVGLVLFIERLAPAAAPRWRWPVPVMVAIRAVSHA